MRRFAASTAVAVAFVLLPVRGARAEEPVTAEQAQFFEKKVRPLLVGQCGRCHGAEKKRGGLRVDGRAFLLAGGDSGPAIVPGKPEESRLLDAVNYRKGLEMPPTKRLAAADVAVLTEWVRLGAPWPGGGGTVVISHKPGEITDTDRAFWSFRPVVRPKVPAVADPALTNPVDAFVAAKLAEKGLSLSPSASPRELVRRLYFDLVGLPPTPEEVDAFVNDHTPDAYEKLVDRLLASPHFGERWGRHWLDVVRFSQTNGYERDDEKPYAWRYRDYVIRAFNDDLPYDQFVREQLAGDELDAVTDASLTATAFYRLGVWDDEPDDKRQAEFDELDDMVSTSGQAFLGLTVGCARCHDHKFDPLGQDDYYGLLAFVRNVKPYVKPQPTGADVIFAKLGDGSFTLAVREPGPAVPPTLVLLRGSAATPGKEVVPHFPPVLCRSAEASVPALPPSAPGGKTSGRRRVLADWVASADNPLTARVLVNRLWQHHFGAGLVPTPNDLGHTGLAPTHPELLDYLAAELVAGGWRMKRLHRLIVTSAAYKQSSRVGNEKAVAVDPGNTLLWRRSLRRLEAEAVRDAILATSGKLNPEMGGRGIFPTLPPEVLATQSRPGLGWGKSDEKQECRRSVYVYSKRTLGVPFLEVFDAPSMDTSTATRAVTTVAPQALVLLNSRFMDDQSAAFADRLLREDGPDRVKNVRRAYRLALGREPTERERAVATAYLERETARRGTAPPPDAHRAALTAFCKLVLNLNEFVYID